MDDELIGALRSRGQRVTQPRLRVYRALKQQPQHVTAEQLQRELPDLSPATIYATLATLEQLGFTRRVSTPSGSTLFDSRTDDHHHALCRRCGTLVDLELDLSLSTATQAAADAGFTVDAAEVQVTGLCGDCSHSV